MTIIVTDNGTMFAIAGLQSADVLKPVFLQGIL